MRFLWWKVYRERREGERRKVKSVKAGKILGELTPSIELICGVGKNEIFGIFLQKNLEI